MRFPITQRLIDWFKNLSKSRKILLIAFMTLLVFCILLFLSGCKSAELKALENSASIIQLQTGREVSRSFQDKGRGLLGKPVYAQTMIGYEAINHYTKRDVYDEIVTILEKNNWKRDEKNIVPDAFVASLQQGDIKIFATVLIDLDKNLVTIYMEAR